MSDVKKMTAKSGFLDLPLGDRKCQNEPFEECKTRALIDKCNCVPWEMMSIQVGFSKIIICIISIKSGWGNVLTSWTDLY